MRKISVVILSLFLILIVGCGKSGDTGSAEKTNPQAKPQADPGPSGNDVPAKPGQKPGANLPGGDIDIDKIDVDKLDIPDRMKEAIKSGRIPKERLREMLAQMSGGPSVPVSVKPVERKNLNSYLVLNGIVEPERKVEIFSRLSTYVKEIMKEEGAYVQENDLLCLLDDTEIKTGFEQAKIALAQAKLSLEEAERTYLRYQELIKKDLISEQDFQTQEAQYKQRQLDHENRLESFKNLQLQLNWTKIRALSEGYIT